MQARVCVCVCVCVCMCNAVLCALQIVCVIRNFVGVSSCESKRMCLLFSAFYWVSSELSYPDMEARNCVAPCLQSNSQSLAKL
jgi:hypothetical protein